MEIRDLGISKWPKLCGALLVLLTNCCYIGNSYLVKWIHLGPGEISLVRGILQIIVFSSIIVRHKLTSGHLQVNTKEDSSEENSLKEDSKNVLGTYLLLIAYGLLTSTSSFSVITAIPLLPIGDLIVLCFISPVFSIIWSSLIIKKPLTLLSIVLCTFIICGDILVVQPSSMFGSGDKNSTNTSDNFNEEGDVAVRHSMNYPVGVGLCLYAAGAVSLANVVQVFIINDVNVKLSTNHFMLTTGVCNVFLSLVSVPVVPNSLLSLPWSMSSLSVSMLLVSALITLLAVWTQVLAVSLTQHPTLVMMMRSTEICISLVTESIYWSHPPHPLSALGSIMVMFCICTMAIHDNIVSYLKKIHDKLQQKSLPFIVRDKKYQFAGMAYGQ